MGSTNSSYARERTVGERFVNDLPSAFFVVGRGIEVSMPSRGDGYEVGDMVGVTRWWTRLDVWWT